ncbi:MAG TPA: DMT family transporter [Bacteroidales bacterium]|nr:DMT family transporter [Bacteroidales bacterium]
MVNRKETFASDGLLLITALIWGLAFVAQRKGMEFIGPFTYNGIRFALGGLSLLPLLIYRYRKGNLNLSFRGKPDSRQKLLMSGIFLGLLLFGGASLQQVGIVYTTAGKAGFITGLYVILVPLAGIFLGQRNKLKIWLGAILALSGMYFLSITGDFSISPGDLLVLFSAFFWTAHVLLIGWLSPKSDSLILAGMQFMVCSILSLITAFFTEIISWTTILQAAVPILYGGILSVGVAYTLQVVAQKKANPAYASIILSLESVFAGIGGYLLLGETLNSRGLLGCCLMFSGMLIAQLRFNVH